MDLLPLALRALNDREARGVLGDAFQELPRDARAALWQRIRHLHINVVRSSRNWGRKRSRLRLPWHATYGSRGVALRLWTRAIVAGLLFAEWPASRFPFVPAPKPVTTADMGRILRDLWPESRVPEVMYMAPPTFEMLERQFNRPTTMAGVFERIQQALRDEQITTEQALQMLDFPIASNG